MPPISPTTLSLTERLVIGASAAALPKMVGSSFRINDALHSDSPEFARQAVVREGVLLGLSSAFGVAIREVLEPVVRTALNQVFSPERIARMEPVISAALVFPALMLAEEVSRKLSPVKFDLLKSGTDSEASAAKSVHSPTFQNNTVLGPRTLHAASGFNPVTASVQSAPDSLNWLNQTAQGLAPFPKVQPQAPNPFESASL